MAEEKKSWGVSPAILVWGGLAAVVVVFGPRLLTWFKDFFAGLTVQPSTTPTGEPALPAKEVGSPGRVTASIVEPGNGGHVYPTLIPFLGIDLKVAVNNPNTSKVNIALRTVVTFYPRLIGQKTSQESSLQLTVDPGRTTHRVRVARPVTLTGSVDAVAEVYINGESVAVPISFVVE